MLQINVGLLVVLGTSLLAMGQQNAMYSAIAIVGAAASIFVTDIKRWFHLSPSATSTAAVLACVVLVIQVIRNVDQSHLLNVANVLIYLEMILMLQEKDDRTYWSLMALSLLQVVVAVALNLGLIYGLLLAAYVVAALSAMVLFYAVRATRPFLNAPVHPGLSPVNPALGGEWIQRISLSLDGPKAILQPSLIRHLGRMLLFIFMSTIVIFFAIPRYGDSVWQGASRDQVTTVGFTEEVQLDNIGLLLENPEQVMRVEFNTMGGAPYHVDTEPYFRGTVLTMYQGSGTWKPNRIQKHVDALESDQDYDEGNLVRQSITLQQGSHSVLFHVAPSYSIPESPRRLFVNQDTRTLGFSSDDQTERRGQFRYELGTTAFRNGWQRDLMPARVIPNRRFDDVTLEQFQARFPNLTDTAQEIQEELDPNASVFDRVKAMEAHFRSSGRYRYSLDVNRNRDRSLDPVEDFVGNHRTGHCEYFAGALTLMLWSQNIPARMVVGFKGGEYNTVGNYYIVRQLHAHAWVEVYLGPDEIPVDEWDTTESREMGAWLRLDPTPGGNDIAMQSSGLPIVIKAREFADYLQVLWDDYVLGLNATRQQQMIYGPLMQSLRTISYELFSYEAWQNRLLRVGQFWRRLMNGQVVTWPWLAGSILLTSSFFGMLYRWRSYWMRPFRKLVGRWQRQATRRRRATPQCDVYARLEHVLALQGWHRPDPVTPSEFARQMHHHLLDRTNTAPLADIPARVTQAYYRVRYGAQELTGDETRALLADVGQLEVELARRPGDLSSDDAPTAGH